MNVHGGVAAGEFQVFKYAPLAARGGRYASYDSPADQYHRNCISTNVVLFTDPNQPSDRGDQRTRSGLKTDHATWDQWLALRERHEMDVATITDWQVREGETRCRADLTRTNPTDKCTQWIRDFVWLANRHLLVLDIVETASPQIRRQWQLHSPTVPEMGDRLVTIQNAAPDQRWADPQLQPKDPRARLFCQTLLPAEYVVMVHGEDGATSYTASGQLQGSVEGNMHHRQFGRHVLQFDPGNDDSRNVFLHVLTAVEAAESTPPAVSWRMLSRGKLEVKVDGAATQLTVPDWFGE